MMKVLQICSEDASPMRNIISLYKKTLKQYSIKVERSFGDREIKDHDIVHGHYALTKPVISAYRKSKRAKIPFILHCHGSDVRSVSKDGFKKLPLHHSLISRYVRKRSDKVLLSTPDLLEFAEGEYLPNPVDLDLFRPMDMEKKDRILLAGRFTDGGGILELIDPDRKYDCINWGDDIDFPGNVQRLDFVDHEELPKLFNKYKKMIGPLVDPVSLTRLEAMACGLETYTEFPQRYVKFYDGEDPDKVSDPRGFIERYHHPEDIVKRLVEIYKELLNI